MGGMRGAVVLVVLLLLAGCTTISGQPSPADPTATAPALPPRPRELRINGVHPCTLLTDAQLAELGLDGRPVFDRSPSLLYPGEVSACVTEGFRPRAVAVGVSLVTTVGIEFFTSGEPAADIRLVQVAGFPGAVARPTRYPEFCTVVVDVAPGQLVDVQFRSEGQRPPIPQEQLCRDAEQAAAAVMETLTDLR